MTFDPNGQRETSDKGPREPRSSAIGYGIPIGVGLGVPLGLVFDNLALGIALGAAIGTALGVGLDRWHKGEEIDLVGMNTGEKELILAEVKWSDLGERDVDRALEGLRRKGELLGLDDHEKHYSVIARKADVQRELVFDSRDFDGVF